MAATKSTRTPRARHPVSPHPTKQHPNAVLDRLFTVRDGINAVLDHMEAIRALVADLPDASTETARRRIMRAIQKRTGRTRSQLADVHQGAVWLADQGCR
jgi:hypothetical protein